MAVRGITGGGADASAAIEGGDAWHALVERHAVLVEGICQVHGLTPGEAEAVHTMVWLRLAERLPRLHHPEAVGAWLAATTRLQCLHALARREDGHGREPVEEPDTGDRQPGLEVALDGLDPVERDVLRLRAIVPRPTEVEVGAALALSPAEVLAAEQRGAARLRARTTPGTVWHVEVRAPGSAAGDGAGRNGVAHGGIGATLGGHGR
ncbi:MAG: sigma-70 family RNA polymerase sigma factor [Acidimicrobiia bacterium]